MRRRGARCDVSASRHTAPYTKAISDRHVQSGTTPSLPKHSSPTSRASASSYLVRLHKPKAYSCPPSPSPILLYSSSPRFSIEPLSSRFRLSPLLCHFPRRKSSDEVLTSQSSRMVRHCTRARPQLQPRRKTSRSASSSSTCVQCTLGIERRCSKVCARPVARSWCTRAI